MTINMVDPAVRHDGVMVNEPRSDRPRRRSFSPTEKLRLLAGYETATQSGGGNAFLRENGLYSWLISEWRRTRDAGLSRGRPAGVVVGRPSADQAEIARLRRQLDVTEKRLESTATLTATVTDLSGHGRRPVNNHPTSATATPAPWPSRAYKRGVIRSLSLTRQKPPEYRGAWQRSIGRGRIPFGTREIRDGPDAGTDLRPAPQALP